MCLHGCCTDGGSGAAHIPQHSDTEWNVIFRAPLLFCIGRCCSFTRSPKPGHTATKRKRRYAKLLWLSAAVLRRDSRLSWQCGLPGEEQRGTWCGRQQRRRQRARGKGGGQRGKGAKGKGPRQLLVAIAIVLAVVLMMGVQVSCMTTTAPLLCMRSGTSQIHMNQASTPSASGTLLSLALSWCQWKSLDWRS